MKTVNKAAAYLAGFVAIAALILLVIGKTELLSIPAIVFFFSLALAVRSNKSLKGFSFTIMIFAAVTASMSFPSLFTEIGGFDLKKLIVPLLMIIMFGMGTAMSIKDFVGIVKMPKGVIIGIICQFTIMPFIGFGLATLSGLPPEIAAGIILIGCSPSGLASNVMSYLANANLALSLTLTAVATLLAPIITPFLMKLLADQLVPINFLGMLQSILKIVIYPIIAGLLFNHFFHGKFKWVDKAMPVVSMAGIAIIIAVITAAGRDSLMTIGLTLIAVVLAHNLAGYVLGFSVSRMLGLDRKSSQTVALEVGMQNGGLASGIALEMGRVATMGLAPAVFGPLMNITGSSLAMWWRGKNDDLEEA